MIPIVKTMLLEAVIAELEKLGAKVEPCGSRVTCSPAPTDTDEDYLVELPNTDSVRSDMSSLMSDYEFRLEGCTEHYNNATASGFTSWRRDDINFIITSDKEFARRHRAATYVCKRLNLLNKRDRIALFQAVLYGNQATHGLERGNKWAESERTRKPIEPIEIPF